MAIGPLTLKFLCIVSEFFQDEHTKHDFHIILMISLLTAIKGADPPFRWVIFGYGMLSATQFQPAEPSPRSGKF